MSGTARVWPAEPDEAEAVARLLVEFRDWWGRDWPSENAFLAGVERLMDTRAAEFLLGAPHDDAPPAGVCQLRYRFSVWYAADDCFLEDLYVRPEARRNGVARALVGAAIDRAREHGCRKMELDVNEANPEAWTLYEGFGFKGDRDPPGGRDVLMRLAL